MVSRTRKNIENINNIITEAKIAQQKAKTAEDMLIKLKNTYEEELKKAYLKGYQDGKKSKDDNSDIGSSSNDDDKKLELKS